MSAVSFAPPRTGFIRGQYNNSRLDLNFDRPSGTVSGEALQAPVSLTTHPDQATITGSAQNGDVNLSYFWSPQRQHYQGDTPNGDLFLDVDYTTHTAVGHSGQSAIDLKFDDYSVKGSAGGDVDLKITPQGQMSGVMCGHPLEAETGNVDMGQMLSNVFLFAPGR